MALPRNTMAERTMLSGLLKEWKWLSPLVQSRGITADSFYHWHHALVFRRLSECATPGPHSLYMRLRSTREYREWKNLPEWIADVWEIDLTGCSCEYAADLVRDVEVRRLVIVKANELIRDSQRKTMAPEEYAAILGKLK